MRCLICPFQSIEAREFIALDFALDKKVCWNCASALGSKIRQKLLDDVKVYPPDTQKGILPTNIKPLFHEHRKIDDPDMPELQS